jgi:hypothetical protein
MNTPTRLGRQSRTELSSQGPRVHLAHVNTITMTHILYALQGAPHNEVITGITEEAMSLHRTNSDQNYGFEIRSGSHICQ